MPTVSCQHCRQSLAVPDSATPDQSFPCPRCGELVSAAPFRHRPPDRANPFGAIQIMWFGFALVAGLFALFGLAGAQSPGLLGGGQIQTLTLIVAGYTICRAVERAFGH